MPKVRIFDPDRNESVEHMFRRFMSNLRNQRDVDMAEIQVDLVEKDGIYKLRADLPGVKKDDVTVRVNGNIIQIDAMMQESIDFKNGGVKVLRSERQSGSLSRTLNLLKDVDENKVTAKLSDGVLELVLPKKETDASELKIIKID
jgi:HSP20 family protein